MKIKNQLGQPLSHPVRQDIHKYVNKNVNNLSGTREAFGGMFLSGFIDLFWRDNHSHMKSIWAMATILNDEEIKKLIGTVIVNGSAASVKPNSYALRLGNAGEFLNCNKEFTLGGAKKGIKLQPGHSVALTAFEVVDFSRETVHKIYPNHDLHAFISPLTDLSREGIVAPTTQVDSGYHGTLNWTITNTSNMVRGFLYQEKLFRLTIFKLAPGETPTNPYRGDYHEKTGYVRSERKGAPQGMRDSEWEDAAVDGSPEAMLESLIKSGYPWNLLGQRLKVIDDQFQTVTNEYGEIKTAIDVLNREVDAMREESRNLPNTIGKVLDEKMSTHHLRWVTATVSAIIMLLGIVLTIVVCDQALKFLKNQGAWIGILLFFIAGGFLFFALKKSRK
jgi:deoxycytidine triphosphate deaminase